jgi:hypothetical protein
LFTALVPNIAMRVPAVRPSAFRLAARTKRWSPAILGGLIVWQLIFIPLANLLEFFPHRVRGADEVTDLRELPAGMLSPPPGVRALAGITDRWSQVTGQYQMWWLFAPEVPPQATFPVVELSWHDLAGRDPLPPIRLHSSWEPATKSSYFRPPGADDRLYHYEMHLGLGAVFWNEHDAAPHADQWRALFREIVQMQWKSMRAYLRWRIRQFVAEHSELPPPDEATLLMRLVPTPPPGVDLKQPAPFVDQPIARWRIAEDGPPGHLPLEAYDPFARRFVSLPLPKGEGTEGSPHD